MVFLSRDGKIYPSQSIHSKPHLCPLEEGTRSGLSVNVRKKNDTFRVAHHFLEDNERRLEKKITVPSCRSPSCRSFNTAQNDPNVKAR